MIFGWFKRSVKANTITGPVVMGNQTINEAPKDPPNLPSILWAPDALRPDASPLSWLTWNARLTDLIGRDKEKAELLRWAREGGGVRFRFLVGEGGSGKTRLAHEIADTLTQIPGWSAGLIDPDRPLPLDIGPAGCLLLIDYPEEKRDSVLTRLEELAKHPSDPTRPVRVLFLTRQGPDFWERLVHQSGAVSHMDRPYSLPDGVALGDAFTLYQQATERAPRPAGSPPPQPVNEQAFRDWLTATPVNQRPLLVVAAALQAVDAPDRSVLTLSGDKVIKALADREVRRLDGLNTRHGFGKDALPTLAALAAAAGGLDEAAIKRLTEAGLMLGLPPNADPISHLNDTGCFKNGWFPAPAPDIVASSLLVSVLRWRPAMAPDWLWAALGDTAPGALPRLARLAYDAEVILGHHDRPLSGWLAAMVKGKPERCEVLTVWSSDEVWSEVLPDASAEVALGLASLSTNDEQKARHLNNASLSFSAAGRNGEALNACDEAVVLYRRLAAADPVRFEPDLAMSLTNLSKVNAEEGAARNASDEAVVLYSRLAVADPVRFELDLAMSLNNLSVDLAHAGDWAAARKAGEKAVEIRRRLAVADPMRLEPKLAMSLNNLSVILADAGDWAAARTAGEEAVEIRRRLAAEDPVRFEPVLALSLNNLSNRLADTGDWAAARKVGEKAASVYRRLAAASPARYGHELAATLGTQARLAFANEASTEALALIEEAIRLIEPAARAYPDTLPGRWLSMMLEHRERYRRGVAEP